MLVVFRLCSSFVLFWLNRVYWVILQFFPKTEKYVSLYCGDDNADLVDKRSRLRVQIKANLIAAAASGKDLEGMPF